MKSCPHCGSQYTDDTLSFCLSDGARLSGDALESAVTVVIGETETVVRPAGGRAEVPVAATPYPPVQPAKPAASRTGLAILLTAAGMLVLFGFVVLIGFFIWRNLDQQVASNTTENRNVSNSTATPTTQPSPKPTATTAKPTPDATPKPTEVKTPELPSLAKYPSTTRLNMGRGAYSTSFSGDINPGDSRTFVLACRAGQSLSATVSGGSCVSFSGGGSSLSRTTARGDNRVTVTNGCASLTRFSLRLSVI